MAKHGTCCLGALRLTILFLANSAQKQFFADKIFVVKLPATPCNYYFMGENFRLYCKSGKFVQTDWSMSQFVTSFMRQTLTVCSI